MTIGQVAKQAGVSVQTIRYYEHRGLITAPARRPSGYRTYAPSVLREVRIVRWGQSLGFRLGEMAELLRQARRWRGAPPRALVTHAERKMREIDDTVRRLRARRRSLALIVQCACRDDCPILDRAVGKRGDTE